MTVSAWIEHGIEVGDMIRVDDVGAYGMVTNIFFDEDGDPAACVLALVDEPGWMTLDLSRYSPAPDPGSKLN